jgi:restriction system protein
MPVRSRFSRYLNPVLQALRELGGSGRPAEVRDWVANSLKVSEADREIQNEGGVLQFDNDVAWARFYLVKTEYLDASKRGVWSLTEKGRAATALSDAQQREIIKAVQALSATSRTERVEIADESVTAPDTVPVEEHLPPETGSVETGSHRERVLEIMKSLPPAGFERLCQRILREAGFQQVRVTGRSGDGGIDGVGILQVNPFVSFKVLFQSKRYSGSVVVGQVRDFRGAMQGRADKGIIITTGTFTADAQREAVRDGAQPVELVDGIALVALLEQLELGLVPRQTYDVDAGFFNEFRA